MANIVDNSNQNDFIPMGRIIGAFGIKGWVKIKPDTQSTDSLVSYKQLHVLVNGTWLHKTIVAHGSSQNNILNVKLDGIDDRDSAMLLRGATIAVPRNEFPTTAEDEYYLVDLMGLHVFNKEQVYFGTVTKFMETGASTVLVVTNDSNNNDDSAQNKIERLIPFIAQYVCDVNLSTKQIIVDWGLDY
jgi:16S rRNA processing protein RimM